MIGLIVNLESAPQANIRLHPFGKLAQPESTSFSIDRNPDQQLNDLHRFNRPHIKMVSRTPFRAAEFRSAYGPKYTFQPNFAGTTSRSAFRVGLKTAGFGASLGVALILFVSGIPRVQKDILQKLPFVGGSFVKQPPHPADNPF
jgi:hypothetical protein